MRDSRPANGASRYALRGVRPGPPSVPDFVPGQLLPRLGLEFPELAPLVGISEKW
jgi:hypothetical protein